MIESGATTVELSHRGARDLPQSRFCPGRTIGDATWALSRMIASVDRADAQMRQCHGAVPSGGPLLHCSLLDGFHAGQVQMVKFFTY